MSNREDAQLLGRDQVRDAVGETGNWELADQEVAGTPGIGIPEPGRKMRDGPVNCREERQPQSEPLSLVPERGLLKLGRSHRLDKDPSAHPSVSARPTSTSLLFNGSPTRHHALVDPDLAQTLLTLLDERRQRALRRRDALQGDFADIVERSSDASRDDEHDSEGATIAFERAQVSSLLSATEQDLLDIDRAVDRVRSGIHDRCETCDGGVSAERLRARPATRTCVDCSRKASSEA